MYAIRSYYARDPFDDVGGVGGDTAGDHPFMNVLDSRQTQMLTGGDVAEEVCAGAGRKGPPDSAGDVVVAGGDVSDQRAEYVERRAVAEAFLRNNFV